MGRVKNQPTPLTVGLTNGKRKAKTKSAGSRLTDNEEDLSTFEKKRQQNIQVVCFH